MQSTDEHNIAAGKDRLRIQIRQSDAAEQILRSMPDVPRGFLRIGVHLEVDQNGKGIAAFVDQRIFEPA